PPPPHAPAPPPPAPDFFIKENTPNDPEPGILAPEPVKTGEAPTVPEPVIAEKNTASNKPTEEPVTYTCEKCGAAVSKVQRDVSNLFMGKTLCKTCMK
ncbi:MAG: hypothetical protein O0V67_02115, partial [Methanocorpusculum sp.]|nr:hypothetical protein [Methanocorpusculum sp.]